MLNNFFNIETTLFYIYLNTVVYLIPLVFFYLYLDESNTSLLTFSKVNKKSFVVKLLLLLFIVNLAGLPPMPGFFIKLNLFLLLSNYTNFIVGILFVVLNFVIFFFYIKTYKRVTYFKSKLTKLGSLNNNKLLLFMGLYIIFYPFLAPYLSITIYSIFI